MTRSSLLSDTMSQQKSTNPLMNYITNPNFIVMLIRSDKPRLSRSSPSQLVTFHSSCTSVLPQNPATSVNKTRIYWNTSTASWSDTRLPHITWWYAKCGWYSKLEVLIGQWPHPRCSAAVQPTSQQAAAEKWLFWHFPGTVATVCGWGGQTYNLLMSSSFRIQCAKND